MSGYLEVIAALLANRPQSDKIKLEKIVEKLAVVVKDEIIRLLKEEDLPEQFQNPKQIWEMVRDAETIKKLMENLAEEVDRIHTLYVYSRFLNSPAVGPPLVKKILDEGRK